jgi:3-keto-5-aminohexanoate cleavage enzyme
MRIAAIEGQVKNPPDKCGTGKAVTHWAVSEGYLSATERLLGQGHWVKEHSILPEIEIFDLSHLYAMRRLMDLGLINERPHVQFVLGIKNALPVEEHLIDLLLGELKRLAPKATWTAAGIGRHQADVIRWVLQRDGDAVRTGLEDNIRIDRDRLASSNAELVRIAAGLCAEHDARPATPSESRHMLGLATA